MRLPIVNQYRLSLGQTPAPQPKPPALGIIGVVLLGLAATALFSSYVGKGH